MKTKDSMNFSVYLRVLKYVRPYLKLAILCVIASLLISIVHFLSLALLNPLGDILFSPQGTDLIYNKLNSMGDTGKSIADYLQTNVFSDKYFTLYVVMVCVGILSIIKGILRFSQDYLCGYISDRVTIDISNELYKKVIYQSVHFFGKTGIDQIVSRFTIDTKSISRGVKNLFGKAIREPLKALASLFICLWIDWQLTLVIFVVFPFSFLLIKNLGRKVKKGSRKTLQKEANLLEILQESFQGLRIVKAYQMEDERIQKFADENNRLFHYKMKVTKADSITSPLMEVVVTISGLFVLILSARMVLRGEISSGDFFVFYASLGALFDPIRKLADVYNHINACIAGGERIFEFMDKEYEIKEKPNAIEFSKFTKNIEFKNVSFSYEKNIPVLQYLSFEIKKGEVVAIVGKNGAGKSTLISLLLRFFDPTSGKILIDGHDVNDFTLKSLRRQFAVVTQRPFLFNTTIEENIRCGFEVDKEGIQEAALKSHVEDFAKDLENGYETIYGKGGVGLSGGQEQRVALARALVRKPSILILDEATANLDADSEHYIGQALKEYLTECTAFIIAHRFATLEQSHRIMVLDQGKIEAFGTHEELMKTSQTYCSLHQKQQLEA